MLFAIRNSVSVELENNMKARYAQSQIGTTPVVFLISRKALRQRAT